MEIITETLDLTDRHNINGDKFKSNINIGTKAPLRIGYDGDIIGESEYLNHMKVKLTIQDKFFKKASEMLKTDYHMANCFEVEIEYVSLDKRIVTILKVVEANIILKATSAYSYMFN